MTIIPHSLTPVVPMLTRISSICVITIFRIVSTLILNFGDFSYTLPYLAISTDLEPILGIINACLPVMRPALRKTSFLPSFGMPSKMSHRNSKDVEYGNPKSNGRSPFRRNLRNMNSQSTERMNDDAARLDSEETYPMEQIRTETTR